MIIVQISALVNKISADIFMFCVRLKEERQRLGLTQPEFAKVADASKRTVVDWEKGVSAPNGFQLSALACIGIDVQYIITGQRSANLLPQDEALILEKYRQADPVTKNKMLMLLLGHNDATSSVVNQTSHTGSGDQFNSKRQKIDKRNQNQTNNFHGNFGGDYVNGDKK